jgi:aryl-phospho-beta-D-glucosidase BglC (GH1 family)
MNLKILKLLILLVPISITISCAENNNAEDSAVIPEDKTVVQIHGLLQVSGNRILDQHSAPICFAGNSFFWSNDNWGGEQYYKSEVVSWLKLDWKTTIVRAAMGVEDPGGYLDNKTANKNRVKTVVDAAIDEGLYVIIDWHSHHAEDNTKEASLFFQEMANLYGEYDNVIYELYNEPLDISWSNVIKPYAISIIAAIRTIDPDNLILVGTPEWSQRVDLAAADPITGYSNIAYTLHFYTVHHQQWLRDRASAALNDSIALFVTEWGSIGYSQIDSEANEWMTWCFDNKISHCNWAVNDKEEEWSILVPGASTSGGWSDDDLTDAGKLARNIIQNWPE